MRSAGLSSGESALDTVMCPLHWRQDEDWQAECFSATSPPLSHSLPVTLLGMDCSLLHLRPLPMSAERGGIRKFPVMPYSASRRSPIHAHGMRQRRANTEHSRPTTSKYERLKPVWEWVWVGVLVHAGCPVFPGKSLRPGRIWKIYQSMWNQRPE